VVTLLPPHPATNSIARHARHARLSKPIHFLLLLENGSKITPATNNEPAAKTDASSLRSAAAPVCGPFVVIVSIVVTTLPFVVSVEGEKLQPASAGKPEQLNEMELLALNPVKGVIASINERTVRPQPLRSSHWKKSPSKKTKCQRSA